MVFSSPIFLFLFLPVVLTVYAVLPGTKARNFFLLLVSLVFYAWGEIDFIFLLLASTALNYGLGLWVDHSQEPARRKAAVAVAVFVNIGVLSFFKYSNFFISSLSSLLESAGGPPIPAPHVNLPLGISFFTFHALSYVIDIYRRKWKAATDPKDVALYIFFFPQLIAGPILRWSAIGPQLLQRSFSSGLFADGIRRFAGGLAKKVLVANTLALPADQIFLLPSNQLSTSDAWFGILCYTLQIYFDFSGYSDMAIGMGKMFGFTFPENFRFPYISRSIREFWRRWHISLSTWFRDYVYIPLGGNRVSEARNRFNLVTVFLLCGLWHGASWTFVVWGLYHGLFLILERTRFGEILARSPELLQHFFTLFIIMMGWVLFRAATFEEAGKYFSSLFDLGQSPFAQPLPRYATNQVVCAIAAGMLFSGPAWDWIKSSGARLCQILPANSRPAARAFGAVLEILTILGLLVVSAAWLASGTYNPFIYFRF